MVKPRKSKLPMSRLVPARGTLFVAPSLGGAEPPPDPPDPPPPASNPSFGAMIWDEVIAHLQSRNKLIRSWPLQSSGAQDANLAALPPANVGTTPGSQTGYLLAIDTGVKPRGMAGSLRHTISGQSQEDSVGWYGNLSTDLLTQIGANEEVYIQWRPRYDANYINTILVASEENSDTVGGSKAINNLTPGNPTSIQVNTHGMATGDWVFLQGTNMLATKHKLEQVTVIDSNNFTVPINSTGQTFGSGFINHTRKITGITKANPAVVTTNVPHGFPSGAYVLIRSTGMTEVNYRAYRVQNPTSTTFELAGVNSTGYGTFTGGAACYMIAQNAKLAILSAGDTGSKIENSCTRNDIVIMGDYYQRKLPWMYHSCGAYQGLWRLPGGGRSLFQSEWPNSRDDILDSVAAQMFHPVWKSSSLMNGTLFRFISLTGIRMG